MSANIKADGNSIVITLDTGVARTGAQKFTIAQMLKRNAFQDVIAYLQSFKLKSRDDAKRVRTARRDLRKTGDDALAIKRPGRYAAMFTRMLDPFGTHSPSAKYRDHIGVEIECMVPYASFSNATCLTCNGTGEVGTGDDLETCYDCRGEGTRNYNGSSTSGYHRLLAAEFKRDRVKWLNVKSDGSIRTPSGYFPVEITVLTRLGDSSNLERACKTLNRLGAKVNKSCGLHVHLDARHLSTTQVKAIGSNFSNALPVMLAMVPESRRTNNYCRPAVSEISGDRYFAVNLTAYSKYRTVEVRLHSSTTNFKKIWQWVRLCSAIASAERVKRSVDINDLSESITIDENLMEYVAQRTALFNGEQSNAESRDDDALTEAV